MLSERLLDRVCNLAAVLPAALAERIAGAFAIVTGSAGSANVANVALPWLDAENRQRFQALLNAWSKEASPISGAEIAAALSAAAAQDRRLRSEVRLELVWTGPASPGSGLRSTEQVLLDLFQSAARSIYLVAFAAYRVPNLLAALQAAARRGVRICLIVEDKEESAGKVTRNPLDALAAIDGGSTATYVWPMEHRIFDKKGRHGSLHAKCVLVDDSRLFVSSANLTEFALNLNIEMGLLVTGGSVPYDAADTLRWLISQGIVAPAGN